jgi:hypothetical protein
VPKIIDYPRVLETLQSQGLVCNYHNSGAFGFPKAADGVVHRGFVGPEDPSILPAALPSVKRIDSPYEQNLATLATRYWQSQVGGEAWVMPMAHWAFELDANNRDWLPMILERIGIDQKPLTGRNDGAAIAFDKKEPARMAMLLQSLLQHLTQSDYMLAFPGKPLLCTVHHHKQLWWSTTEPAHIEKLDALATTLV